MPPNASNLYPYAAVRRPGEVDDPMLIVKECVSRGGVDGLDTLRGGWVELGEHIQSERVSNPSCLLVLEQLNALLRLLWARDTLRVVDLGVSLTLVAVLSGLLGLDVGIGRLGGCLLAVGAAVLGPRA